MDKAVDDGVAELPQRSPEESLPPISDRTRALVLGIALVAVVALGSWFGFVRAALAVGMFFLIASWGGKQMRGMVKAPPEPEIADVSDYGLKYVCSMCGLELKVEVAARDKPPSHCMEPMELVRTGGRPPLRPIE